MDINDPLSNLPWYGYQNVQRVQKVLEQYNVGNRSTGTTSGSSTGRESGSTGR
jgi:hypothetical protein